MTITHAQFEELKRLAAAAGPPPQGLQIHLDSRKLRARGQYLMALEQHGAELIDLAYRGAAARMILAKLSALVPAEERLAANETGATLTEWYTKTLAEHAVMKSLAEDRRTL